MRTFIAISILVIRYNIVEYLGGSTKDFNIISVLWMASVVLCISQDIKELLKEH